MLLARRKGSVEDIDGADYRVSKQVKLSNRTCGPRMASNAEKSSSKIVRTQTYLVKRCGRPFSKVKLSPN